MDQGIKIEILKIAHSRFSRKKYGKYFPKTLVSVDKWSVPVNKF